MGCCGFGHRIYAVTGKNKWAGGSLSIVIATQLAFGIYSIASAVTSPGKFIDFSMLAGTLALTSICSGTATGNKPGPVQVLRLQTD